MTETDKYIGNRIRIRRSIMGVSKAELGRVVDKSDSQIANYESGKSSIAAIDLHKISERLDVPISYFWEQLNL